MEDDEEEERPKVSKTEEKESFLKELDKKISELNKVKEEIQTAVERNEELAARNLLGGKSDAAEQPSQLKKEVTPAEYATALTKGIILN